jgi:hypothetical protein
MSKRLPSSASDLPGPDDPEPWDPRYQVSHLDMLKGACASQAVDLRHALRRWHNLADEEIRPHLVASARLALRDVLPAVGAGTEYTVPDSPFRGSIELASLGYKEAIGEWKEATGQGRIDDITAEIVMSYATGGPQSGYQDDHPPVLVAWSTEPGL